MSAGDQIEEENIGTIKERKGVSCLYQIMEQQKKEEASISNVQKNVVEITVDSGAAESVAPEDLAGDYPLEQTPLTGTIYSAVDGGEIRNLGQRKLLLGLADGSMRGFQFQVTDKVTKPLGSVSRMIHKGNTVVFDESGSYIFNKPTGETTWLREKNGVFVLDAAICPYERIGAMTGNSQNVGFMRQGS